MSHLKVFAMVALGLIALASRVAADCAKCSSVTYAACVNTTAFAVCYDGATPSTQIIQCQEGKICTEEAGICKDDFSYAPACNSKSLQCNECSNLFACVSQVEFSYCNDGALGVTATCPNGYYCNVQQYVDGGSICTPSCLVQPTCSNALAVTTPAPQHSWKETCNSVTTAGYYSNIYDSSCKSFVYCEMYNNVMESVLYNCTSGYFNQVAKKCDATKPSNCV